MQTNFRKHVSAAALVAALCTSAVGQSTQPIDDADVAKAAIDRLRARAATAEATVVERDKQIAALNDQLKPSFDVRAGQSIQAALDKAKAGDVVTVQGGTYADPVSVPAGVTLKLAPDARVTAVVKVGLSATLAGGVVSDVKGANSRTGAAVRLVGKGATLDGVTIERIDGCAIGATEVDAIRINRCVVQDVTGSPYLFGGGRTDRCSKAVVTDNVFRRFNTSNIRWGGGDGICKITRSDELVFTGNRISDGAGPGVWLDIQNSRYLIADNVIDNLAGGVGIYIEISDGHGGVIRGNTVTRCTSDSIVIAESNGVAVLNNTFDRTIALRNLYQDGRIRVYDTVGPDGQTVHTSCPLRDIRIAGNKGPNAQHLSIGTWPGPTRKPWGVEMIKFFTDNNIMWEGNVK